MTRDTPPWMEGNVEKFMLCAFQLCLLYWSFLSLCRSLAGKDWAIFFNEQW